MVKISDKLGSVRAWVTLIFVLCYCLVFFAASWMLLFAKNPIPFEVYEKMIDKLQFAGTINLVVMFYFLRNDRQQTTEQAKGVSNVDSGQDKGTVQ